LLTSGFPGVRGADQRVAECPYPLLNKPYRRDELAQAVRAVLDRDADQARDADRTRDADQTTTGVTRPAARPARRAQRKTHDGARVAIAEQV
jgi:FixJ family two-component response regulator